MTPRRWTALACAAAWVWAAGTVSAQRTDYTPPELEGIEIVDHAGQAVPADLRFVDENGTPVSLGDYLGRGKPVVVGLLYFECPMLCSLVLNGFVEGAQDVDWTPGPDYTVLSVSFDPQDTPEGARLKKANYVEALGRPQAADGWHFLTGDADQVQRLADALGFPYRYLEEREEFSHAAGLFVLAPDGTVSRTLYGISFPSQTLGFSLMEASQGRLGSPLQRLVLYCFAYDSEAHQYTMVARNVMKVGGGLSALALLTMLGVLWMRERRRRPVLVA